jgi:hypothetical protein
MPRTDYYHRYRPVAFARRVLCAALVALLKPATPSVRARFSPAMRLGRADAHSLLDNFTREAVQRDAGSVSYVRAFRACQRGREYGD